MPEDLDTTWTAIRRELRGELPELTFRVWLDPLELAAASGGELVVRAPTHIRSWVAERYCPALRAAARRALGQEVTVRIVGGEWRPETDDSPAGAPDAAAAGGGLNPKYTFEQFVISDGNRLAHAAALVVAEMPAQAYNPLFLYGAPGLGKTHLLHAIGNYVRRYGDGLRVRYATVERFMTDFVSSIRGGGTEAFKARFRDTDVLLIDDVQYLSEKVRTEEEFFHTFNELYESGRQIVVTSDRQPDDLEALAVRLRERFESGLVVDMNLPDLGARLAILRQRARHDELEEIEDDALFEIASRVTSSVRALEGALVRVVAYSSLRGSPATAELAREVLGRERPGACGRAGAADAVAAIQRATAEEFGLDRAALLAYDRRPSVAFPRQVAMFLTRELTGETLDAIGRQFGGRNHATVMSAYRRVERELRSNGEAERRVNALRGRLEDSVCTSPVAAGDRSS